MRSYFLIGHTPDIMQRLNMTINNHLTHPHQQTQAGEVGPVVVKELCGQ